MLGHTPRFYNPPTMQPAAPYGGNPLYALSRLSDDVRFDLNRNSLQERHFYHGKTPKYYKNVKDKNNVNRNSFIIRNHMSRVAYTPYPVMPQSPYYKTSPTDHNEYIAEQNGGNNRTGYHFGHVGEYCAELLNRDKHYWTDDETALMLELYEENRDHFTDSKTKKTKVWSVIANIVNKRYNTNVNSEQCSQKYRNLKAEFLKIADSTSFDGGAKKFGRHFRQMKRLLEAEEKYLRSHHSDWEIKEVLESSSVTTNPTNGISPSNNNNFVKYATENIFDKSRRSSTSSSSNTSPSTEKANQIPNDSPKTGLEVVKKDSDIKTKEQDSKIQETDRNENKSNDDSTQSLNNQEATMPETNMLNPVKKNVKDKDEEVDDSTKEDDSTKVSSNKYMEELSYVFHEYFLSRSKALEVYEHKEKENVVCMNKCIEVFRKVLKDNME